MASLYPYVYLAGPGVFRPDALDWGNRLQAACIAHGWRGLYPLDGGVPAGLTKPEQRRWIFNANCKLIRQADAVLADLRAFRSQSEPDSGTAFEVGYAQALGKPVWLCLPTELQGQDLIARVGSGQDIAGNAVEDFAAPLNLMLWEAAAGVVYADEPEAAVAQFAQCFT
ncbi:nucleoside 2-deoxyribosyltransferase [Andreprevotia chitinilytica]|uniref:nucleoside 2-deoxyribosyltransferase n=1 Tax=Andreprevotia chitinilytica TaxID=396808 RepID=UPI00054E81A8|nr:nucleoside 2-deoxyribosyltransferase [Andreprevotia chitinilytica]